MAYESNVSGSSEIYIERYPELGNRQLISSTDRRLPVWSRDGRELFFSSLDGLFEFPLLPVVGSSRPYDIAPDGRFLIIRSDQTDAAAGAASQIVLIQDWFEELKRLVPRN